LIHIPQQLGSMPRIVENTFFDQILLSDGMFSSHMPARYMGACQGLAAGLP